LSAPSTAVTVMALAPSDRGMEALQLVVPVAVPLGPPATLHSTRATLLLSEAVPDTVMGLALVRNVGSLVGAWMLMVGGWVSTGSVGLSESPLQAMRGMSAMVVRATKAHKRRRVIVCSSSGFRLTVREECVARERASLGL
jgi:hypothetical protein